MVVVVVVGKEGVGKVDQALGDATDQLCATSTKATSAVSQPASILINAGMVKCPSLSFGRLQ